MSAGVRGIRTTESVREQASRSPVTENVWAVDGMIGE